MKHSSLLFLLLFVALSLLVAGCLSGQMEEQTHCEAFQGPDPAISEIADEMQRRADTAGEFRMSIMDKPYGGDPEPYESYVLNHRPNAGTRGDEFDLFWHTFMRTSAIATDEGMFYQGLDKDWTGLILHSRTWPLLRDYKPLSSAAWLCIHPKQFLDVPEAELRTVEDSQGTRYIVKVRCPFPLDFDPFNPSRSHRYGDRIERILNTNCEAFSVEIDADDYRSVALRFWINYPSDFQDTPIVFHFTEWTRLGELEFPVTAEMAEDPFRPWDKKIFRFENLQTHTDLTDAEFSPIQNAHTLLLNVDRRPDSTDGWRESDDPTLLYWATVNALKEEDFKEAAETLKHLAHLRPTLYYPYFSLCALESLLKHSTPEMKALAAQVMIDGSSPELVELAESRMPDEAWAHACLTRFGEEHRDRALELDPKLVWLSGSRAYYKEHKDQEVPVVLARTRPGDPRRNDIFRGVSKEVLEKECVPGIEAALKADPKNVPAAKELWEIYGILGRTEDRESLKPVLETAGYRFEKDRYVKGPPATPVPVEEVERWATKVLAAAKDDPAKADRRLSAFTMQWRYKKLGMDDKCLEWVKRGVEYARAAMEDATEKNEKLRLRGRLTDRMNELAWGYIERGNLEAAAEMIPEILAFAPDSTQSERSHEYYYRMLFKLYQKLAEEHLKNGDTESFEKYLGELREILPDVQDWQKKELDALQEKLETVECMESTGRNLEIRVIDSETKKPLEGVYLDLYAEDLDENLGCKGAATTDSDGRARLLVYSRSRKPVWQVIVTARKKGFAQEGVRWSDRQAKVSLPEFYELAMGPPVSMGGIVRDEEGVPFGGASVSVDAEVKAGKNGEPARLEWPFETKTDENGRWSLESLPSWIDDVEISVSHPSFSTFRKRYSNPEEISALFEGKAEIILQKFISIRGRVIDESGRPILGALVHYSTHLDQVDGAFADWTDGNGRFRIERVRPDVRYYDIVAEATGYSPAVLPWRNKGTSTDMDMEFKLRQGLTFRGRVLGPNEEPVSGAKIEDVRWDAPIPGTKWTHWVRLAWSPLTDSEGGFAWNSAPEGDLLLDVQPPQDHPEWVTAYRARAVSPAENWTVRLYPPVKVRGSVTDISTGRPIEQFRVKIDSDRFGDGVAWVRSSWEPFEKGSYEVVFSQGAPESFLLFDAPGYQPSVSRLFTPDEGEQIYNVALRKGIEEGAAIPFADTKFEAAVVRGLRGYAQAPLYRESISGVSGIDGLGSDISKIDGIEYFTRLHSVCLDSSMARRGMGGRVGPNHVSDLSPLANLRQIKEIHLESNPVRDLSPLAELTNLRVLDLTKNQVQDLTPLRGLTRLENLRISGNPVEDLAPLLALPNLKEVHIGGCPLNANARNFQIPQLKKRGVRVFVPMK